MSAVAVGVGFLVAGCSPVKMGAAAIVGNQRITIATLDTEVTNLSQAVKRYPGTVQLSQAQQTQGTLTWLVRFQINDELARQAGITISRGQAQQALKQIVDNAKAQAQAQGLTNVTQDLILAANGIPPNKSAELGRWQAIEEEFIRQANGGTLPTSTAAQQAVTAKLQRAECVAAKTLKIQINPQFGRMDYSQYQVVAAPAAVSRSAGPTPAPSASGTSASSGLTPAC